MLKVIKLLISRSGLITNFYPFSVKARIHKTMAGLFFFGRLLIISAVIGWWLINRKARQQQAQSAAVGESDLPEIVIASEEIIPVESEPENAPSVEFKAQDLQADTWDAKPALEGDPPDAEANTQAVDQTGENADDLARIEGVGPKISAILNQAGIMTFAQLAETPASRLQQIMAEAGLRLARPDTWPEQAVLAAAGKWVQLAEMQNQLNAGRRRE
jgi:predicted flap endonuclease-1-like 5' DNA nuclease